MTTADKEGRDFIERLQVRLIPGLSDFRKLSRPVRQTSQFPTVQTMRNALKKLLDTTTDLRALAEPYMEHLRDIHEEAKRERARRV
jgi:hypothetical protein